MFGKYNLLSRFKSAFPMLLTLFLLVSACVPLAETGEPSPTSTPSNPAPSSTPTQPLPDVTPTKAPVVTSTSISGAITDSARLALAQFLGKDVSKITVILFEAVDWPDSCLGISRKGVMCAQVITPGYRIGLQAGGQAYEYHTNLSGSTMLLASAPDVVITLPVITYHREGGIAGFCDDVFIYANGKAKISSCKSSLSTEVILNETQLASLTQWLDKFEEFDYQHKDPAVADAMSVSLKLIGNGQNPASDADIQSILALMSQLVLQTNR